DEVGEAELGDENPRMAAWSDILVHERQPDDRRGPHVEHDWPRDESLLRPPLHLPRHEMIVWSGQVAAGDLALRRIQSCCARIRCDISPDEPVGLARREAGERILDDASPGTG